MNIKNTDSIKYLAENGILPTETFTNTVYNTNTLIIETKNSQGQIIKKRIITDNITNDDIYIALEIKKYEKLKSINSILSFFATITVIGIAIGIIGLFIN